MMNLESLCAEVADLARQTGAFIRQERATFSAEKIETKGRNDLVSYVDKEAEQRIVARLRTLLPAARFVAEEGTDSVDYHTDDLHGDLWVIDPLDGTTNFIHDFPMYAVSIGLVRNRRPVLGVIYEVGRDECFYGWEGGGAFCNGAPIRVSEVNDLADGLLITGFPYYDFDKLPHYVNIFSHFMQATHGVRRLGSAATDLAYIAAGRSEGFFEYNLKPWDVAAGVLLVREAGGKVTDFRGGDECVFSGELVAAGPVHEQMRQAIVERWYAEI